MIKRKIVYYSAVALIALAGCSPKLTTGNYAYHTECLGFRPDGIQQIKAWGEARTQRQALSKAQENAINEVLFTGIREGKADCGQAALLQEVNARQKYNTFFNLFLADGGEYQHFISLIRKKGEQKIESEHRENQYSFIFSLDRDALRRRLITEGILKNTNE